MEVVFRAELDDADSKMDQLHIAAVRQWPSLRMTWCWLPKCQIVRVCQLHSNEKNQQQWFHTRASNDTVFYNWSLRSVPRVRFCKQGDKYALACAVSTKSTTQPGRTANGDWESISLILICWYRNKKIKHGEEGNVMFNGRPKLALLETLVANLPYFAK